MAWVGAVLFIGVLFSEGRVMKGPPEVLPSWALVVSLSPELQPPQAVSLCGDLPLLGLYRVTGKFCPSPDAGEDAEWPV